MQRDPIGIRGGLNVYAYVANNPPRGVDPEGLFAVWPTGPNKLGDGKWSPGLKRFGERKIRRAMRQVAGRRVIQGAGFLGAGVGGASLLAVSCTAAAGAIIGTGIGIGIDYGVKYATGTKFSTYIGVGLGRTWPNAWDWVFW